MSAMGPRDLIGDFNMAAFWAGITAFVWYTFGAVPLHMAVIGQIGLDAVEASSWIFIVWFTGAITSIVLTLRYRQPIPITWSIPGLVYMGTLAGQYSFAEMVGANLMAGALIVVLGIGGIGARVMAWLPLSIVMGMFGGSILGYVTRMVSATVADVAVAGAAVAGYLIGRFVASPQVPPLGLAVLIGGGAVAMTGQAIPEPVAWSLPQIAIPAMKFSFAGFVAISLPMVVLAMGLGNVQGIGFLLAQGYRPPVNTVTISVGINSTINALFGGHPAIVARTGVAILASPDAGPAERRYWSNLIASVLLIGLALAAAPVSSLIAILPSSYVVTLAGLAILSAFQDSLQRAFGKSLRFGALVAFGVAATPFAIAGISSAFWAILAGLAGSLIAERGELYAHWRGETDTDKET